ncbi:hypothetical protein [Aminobacterium colombiense]|jgi:transcription elongation factor Elf1|uniref:hypothetical protein n=1 Tax=Aminobacterium colombiense TaxID=81468 RepID=UPI0025933C51|nr:hypothetical protein [uncultured Aminobacterium sp.]
MAQIVKTETIVHKIIGVALDFDTFNETYRRIRSNYKYKGFECYSCGKCFENGETIALVFTDKGNKTVCRKCGLEFQEQLRKEVNNE